MLVKEDFLNKLRYFFSLNLYESRIWTALLSRGVSTAGELSDIGNVPRSRAYDILESLEKKGFVVMKLGKPIKYLAVDPKEVVERAKKIAHIDADEKSKRLDNLNGGALMNELSSLFTQGITYVESRDLAGALRGRGNLYLHLETMLKDAQKSVILATSSKGLVRKADSLRSTLEKLNNKKVKIRIATVVDDKNKKVAKELSKYADVRTTKNMNARFCIVDGKQVMLMLMNDEDIHPNYDIGVWVTTPYFSKALEDMFNAAWKDMNKIR